jgi:heat shock protein HslJ
MSLGGIIISLTVAMLCRMVMGVKGNWRLIIACLLTNTLVVAGRFAFIYQMLILLIQKATMKKIIFVLMGFICCMSACKVQKNTVDYAAVPVSVVDREWIAVKIGNEDIEQLNMSRPPNIKLSDGKVSGYSSCNRFHGIYIMKENKITFEQIVMTKMLCHETNEIESAYLKALSNVQSWEYKEGKLYFLNQEKQPVIIFK